MSNSRLSRGCCVWVGIKRLRRGCSAEEEKSVEGRDLGSNSFTGGERSVSLPLGGISTEGSVKSADGSSEYTLAVARWFDGFVFVIEERGVGGKEDGPTHIGTNSLWLGLG